MFPPDIGLFHLERTHPMDDYKDSIAYLYVHRKHKCQFLFIHNPHDSHNMTSILVKTPTIDNSGVNHIVEHLICCRSEKYGSGKAWEQLESSSFNTGMEAYTCSTHTCFTFSTVNKSSFEQSIPVILDLVFHAELTEVDFLKEGHRFEDEDGELKHNGVVYNEVVADRYDTSTYLSTENDRLLFDGCVGRFDISGVEEEIEKLTLEDVKQRYNKYFTPSNAVFYHYGNFDSSMVIGAVDRVISDIEYVPSVFDRSIYLQPRWDAPRDVRIKIQPPNETKPLDEQFVVMVSWYVCNAWDVDLCDDMGFVASQIWKSNSSPMYEALIETGLAESFTGCGMDDESPCCSFTIGVDGVKKENVDRVIEVIHETLEKVVKEGLNKERKQSTFNSWVLSLMTPSWSEGSEIFETISVPLSLECDPFSLLDFGKSIEETKQKDQQNERYWENLIQKHLIDNPHRLTLIGEPVEDFVVSQNTKTAERLKEKRAAMTEEELNELARQSELLEDESDTAESKTPIPEFHRCDLSRGFTMTVPARVEDKVAVHVVPSMKYCYVGVEVDLHLLPDDLHWLNLILIMWNAVGAGSHNEKERAALVNTYCDGFSFSIQEIESEVGHEEDFPIRIQITVGCLDEFGENTMELFSDIMLNPHFNSPKVAEIEIPRSLGNLMENVTSWSRLARYAQLGFTKIANYTSLIGGYNRIISLQKAVNEGNYENLCCKLQSFYDRIMKCATFKGFVNCSSDQAVERIFPRMKELVNKLNTNGAILKAPAPEPYNVTMPDKVYLSHSVTSSSLVIAIQMETLPDERAVLFYIVAETLTLLLYDCLRDAIGVYTVSARYKECVGSFVIGTECDPKPQESIEAIRECLESIANGDLSDETVNHAVVSGFGVMDAPRPAHLRGIMKFLRGHTQEWIAKRRNAMYDITREQIIDSVKYLLTRKWHTVILSNPSVSEVPSEFTVVELNDLIKV